MLRKNSFGTARRVHRNLGCNALGHSSAPRFGHGFLTDSRSNPSCWRHLWFLYYLSIFYVIVAAIWLMGRALSLSKLYDACLRASGGIVRNPVSVLVLALLSFGVLLTMPSRLLETFSMLWPLHWNSLGGYFLFFAWGWILYTQPDALYASRASASLFACLRLWRCFSTSMPSGAPAQQPRPLQLPTGPLGACSLMAVRGALSVALFVYGLIGVFVRYFEKPNTAIRYVAESSYWLYPVHLPVVLFLSALMLPWDAPAFVKVAINLTVSTGLLLMAFDVFGTFTRNLYEMADWLQSCRVRTVAMESVQEFVRFVPSGHRFQQKEPAMSQDRKPRSKRKGRRPHAAGAARRRSWH